MAETTNAWASKIIDQVKGFANQAVQVGKGAYEGGKAALESTAPDALRASGPMTPTPVTPPNPAGSIQDTIAGAAQESRVPPTAALPPAQRLEATPLSQTIQQAANDGAQPGAAPANDLAAQNRAARLAKYGPEGVAQMEAAGAKWGGKVPPTGGGTPPGAVPPPNGPGYAVGKDFAQRLRGGTAKVGGLLGAGAEFLDPNVRSAVDPTSDMSATDRLKQAARSSLRVGGGILGAAGGAALGGVVGSIPLGIAGGGFGYKAGDKAADWIFGEEAQPANAQGTPATPTPAQVKPAAPSQVQPTPEASTGFRTLSGPAKISANKFINGTDVPPEGTGYIRNNQTGNTFKRTGNTADDYNKANAFLQSRGFNPNNVAPPPPGQMLRGGASTGDELAPFRDNAAKGGVHAMAALGAYGALSRQKAQDASYGLRAQAIQASTATARARLGYDMAKDQRDYATGRSDHAEEMNAKNREVFDKDVTDQATAMVGAQKAVGIPGMQKGDPTYDSQIKAKKADLAGDIKYSLGNRKDGKQYGQLGETEKQQLFLLKNFKDKVIASRGTKTNWTHDFFGSGRADSRDLYSYAPSEAEGSIIPFSGGIRVATKNGNTMTLTDAAGGGFNFTGPNDPADADLMQLMQPAIDRYRKAHEGK